MTVKINCDREKEVQSFVSEEYWTVGLKLRKEKSSLFEAELSTVDGKKLEIHDKVQADSLVADLEKQSFAVQEVKKRQRQRKPAAPFTTSSMQQDAARKLGFTSRKTMMLAQQLYEGIDLGRKGPVGLITYMRTDSTRLHSRRHVVLLSRNSERRTFRKSRMSMRPGKKRRMPMRLFVRRARRWRRMRWKSS